VCAALVIIAGPSPADTLADSGSVPGAAERIAVIS
jgi:hypothetical protein